MMIALLTLIISELQGSLHLVLPWVRFLLSYTFLVTCLHSPSSGPIIGRWNFFLERHFPLRKTYVFKGRLQETNVSMKALGKRVAADQLLMCVPLLPILLTND